MNTSCLVRWLVGLPVVVGFVGCTNFPVPTVSLVPGQQQERTVTQELSGNTALVSIFRYDTHNRLRSILTYQTPDSTIAPVESSIYTYDKRNRLTELKHDVVRGAKQETVSQTYSYVYNEKGQPAEIKYTKNDGNGGLWMVGLQYDTTRRVAARLNRVTVKASSFNPDELSVPASSTFTFMGNNLTLVNQVEPVTDTTTAGPGFSYRTNGVPFCGKFIIPAYFRFANVPGPVTVYYTYQKTDRRNSFHARQDKLVSAVMK